MYAHPPRPISICTSSDVMSRGNTNAIPVLGEYDQRLSFSAFPIGEGAQWLSFCARAAPLSPSNGPGGNVPPGAPPGSVRLIRGSLPQIEVGGTPRKKATGKLILNDMDDIALRRPKFDGDAGKERRCR